MGNRIRCRDRGIDVLWRGILQSSLAAVQLMSRQDWHALVQDLQECSHVQAYASCQWCHPYR